MPPTVLGRVWGGQPCGVGHIGAVWGGVLDGNSQQAKRSSLCVGSPQLGVLKPLGSQGHSFGSNSFESTHPAACVSLMTTGLSAFSLTAHGCFLSNQR